MKSEYHYEIGVVRWRRFAGYGDVRSYRANNGWEVEASLIDHHPITGRQLNTSQWWIKETFTGA